MDGPEKLRAYLDDREFTYKQLAGILGTTEGWVTQWMCGHTRPNVVLQYQIEYLTNITGDRVKPEDWLSKKEKAQIEAAKRAIRRLRRSHPIERPTIRDQIKGRL